jgi:hypothetical protein
MVSSIKETSSKIALEDKRSCRTEEVWREMSKTAVEGIILKAMWLSFGRSGLSTLIT